MGPWYAELGRGDGASVVDDTPWVARGHSRETTFQRDLTEPAQVDDAVRELTARVLEDVVAEGRPVVGLTLKVRYAPFFTKTHAKKIPETFDRDEILARALGPCNRNRSGPAYPAPWPAGRNDNARRRPKGTYAEARRLVTASTSGGAELLGRRTGASTGTGLWSAFRIISEMINTGQQGSVVSLSCDPGDRYLDKYYSDEWLAENKIDVGPYYRRLETFMNTGTLA